MADVYKRQDIYSFLPIPDLEAASQRIRQKLGTAVFRIKERTVHHGAFIDAVSYTHLSGSLLERNDVGWGFGPFFIAVQYGW